MTIEEMNEVGISYGGEKMDNGEYRFRLVSSDGSAYIRTEMPGDAVGAWQNAHMHKGVQEMYIVQEGMVGTIKSGEDLPTIYHKGSFFYTEVGIGHNVFMFPGAVIHTVKYGNIAPEFGNPEKGGADWWPDNELDKYSKTYDL